MAKTRRLAEELCPQLEQIALAKGLARVNRVEMIIGRLHGHEADALAKKFKGLFRGTRLAGAEVVVKLVETGQTYTPPGTDEPIPATGWEILVKAMEGEE